MKNLVFMCVALFSCVFAFAGSYLTVESGSTKFLKDNAKAVVTFDYTNAVWENNGDFKKWCGEDYEARVNNSAASFVESFNNTSKGLQVTTNDQDAKYEMNFKVDKLERHQAIWGFWGQGKIFVTGTLTVTDKTTGEQVCKMAVQRYGYNHGEDYDTTDGMTKCYFGLAKQINK